MMRVFTSCLLFIETGLLFAQVNYQQEYINAKTSFREGNYDLAMEGFEQLITYDPNNPFPEYASFYYALSAYKRGYLAVSKDAFDKIVYLYPDWDQMDEVHYWLAAIHFDQQEYFQAKLALDRISGRSLMADIHNLEKRYISKCDQIETLQSLHERYPDDEIVGKRLATVLSLQPPGLERDRQLEELIDQYHLEATTYIEEIPKTIHKDRYVISVLFPLMMETLEPRVGRKRNQIFLDLLEGMQLAADTLKTQGINLEIRAYDTKRDTTVLRRLLETEELKHSDLLVGPLFPEEILVAKQFSRKYKINMFNPVSRQEESLDNNPYYFFFQAGNAVLGRKAAQFLDQYLTGSKKCMVFFGPGRGDTVMVNNFLREAKQTTLDIFSWHPVTRETSGLIIDTLTTATEFDEFNNPTQFTLPVDSVDCIFVASEDPLIYSKVISSAETRGDSVVIVGLESWLDQSTSDYSKYERQVLVLAAPNFVRINDPPYRAFRQNYTHRHGVLPGDFATMGYRFMLFAGHLLDRYGVYFQEGLHEGIWTPGYLSPGYDYTGGNDNHYIPYIRFQRGELVVVESLR